jgi:hypothetical protein
MIFMNLRDKEDFLKLGRDIRINKISQSLNILDARDSSLRCCFQKET